MRSLLGFLSGVTVALCVTAASAQDIAIDVDQSFTAHPERFGLSAPHEVETLAVSPPAQPVATTADQTTPVGEGSRVDARDQGNGEATSWDDKESQESGAEH